MGKAIEPLGHTIEDWDVIKKAVLQKCEDREKHGYKNLTDSNIMDIIEDCERKGVRMTRKDLECLGMD